MKTKILKLVLCAFAALPLGVWADEEVVSTATTWTFNAWTTADNVYTANNAWYVNEKLYARSINSRSYSIKELGSATPYTFADGHQVSVSKYAQTSGNFTVSGSATLKTAGEASNDATPAFAFNTSVPYPLFQYFSP